MIGTPPPNRDRFLAAIAERVNPDTVQAVFLFAPMRQGPVETGVAVLAIDRITHNGGTPQSGTPDDGTSDSVTPYRVTQEGVAQEGVTQEGVAQEGVAQEGVAQEGVTQEGVTQESVTQEGVTQDGVTQEGVTQVAIVLSPTVLTARYRHTLKGPDRGKWELEILEQADAPMITIEMVVRGVQARLDDGADPERLEAAALRAALAEGVWTPPQR